ncbi:hypothetical protein NUW54_g6330 [Trametes sanguinea]|uniref:Uncharacterized protein n=1 Tax=Trametes sanguinea TaxID=158606 RepID=A0ACC1PU08_9APHY|nr:hypothetical protein NUW54_g6330 [Trametes sanguinea]
MGSTKGRLFCFDAGLAKRFDLELQPGANNFLPATGILARDWSKQATGRNAYAAGDGPSCVGSTETLRSISVSVRRRRREGEVVAGGQREDEGDIGERAYTVRDIESTNLSAQYHGGESGFDVEAKDFAESGMRRNRERSTSHGRRKTGTMAGLVPGESFGPALALDRLSCDDGIHERRTRDTRHLSKGSTVYLPVEVDGALFSIGDGHAAQGDGEVCGTAIETPMQVTVRLTVVKDKPYVKTPHFTTHSPHGRDEEYYCTTGVDCFRSRKEPLSWSRSIGSSRLRHACALPQSG